jgi:lipoprotein-anchoring transpeptidase ErfK/SrfK
VTFAFLAIGCAGHDRRLNSSSTSYLGSGGSGQDSPSHPGAGAYWDGDNVSGAPSMVLNLTQQKLYYYKGGQLVGMSPVSTGREGYNTPAGDFKVLQKDRDHVSTLYGNFVDASGNVVAANVSANDPKPPGASFRGASMPYFMRLHGGVGTHAGFLPGIPDSHGCIRMPEKMAAIFFENTPVGTPVKITY